MNYWHILEQARDALQEGRFRAAEQALGEATAARDADSRRVFVSETVPNGLRRLWRRFGGEIRAGEPGRWERAVAEFTSSFRSRAEAMVQQAARQLDLGFEAEPETSFDLLSAALYLSVGSRLCERRLAAAPLLAALFELLPVTGRLGDRDLVTEDLVMDASTRLHVAGLARDHLGRLPDDERNGWAATIIELLDAPHDSWSPTHESDRRWLAAGLADVHFEEVDEVLSRWAAVDAATIPDPRRHWSRLRRVEILGGCDRRRPAIPRHEEARRLAADVPDEGDGELARRLRDAREVLAHRRPQAEPDRGWLSAARGDDGLVRAVFWWGAEPRDVAVWSVEEWSAGDRPPPESGFIAAAGDRIIWQDEVVSRPEAASKSTDSRSPLAIPGRVLQPYLEAVLEPLLPAGGWSSDLAHRLALARSGPWRDGWPADLGHPLLEPPGQDGHLRPEQAELEPALHTGLLWLAVLGRVDEADPSLRAGLGELGRRGDAAAGFLHACAVLGAPDKVAVDAGFEAWTLPLLWTRPDPLTTARSGDPEDATREDLAGQDVAVVVTGRPGRVLAAWGPGQRRWRVVLDRIERLGQLRRQAREAYGPVTVVPPAGQVHHLGAALRRLEELAAAEATGGDDLLAVCHWIRLVEAHNGDLLDYRIWRPRPPGTCPLHDRYAKLVADLQRQPVPVIDSAPDGGWGDQYAQRVRRSGLVAGLVEDLPAQPQPLDAVWGVFDGSEASWVFLDTAAVHWRLAEHGTDRVRQIHELLAPRGRRHLSLLSGRGLFPEALVAWLDEVLADYGRPYHLDLADTNSPHLLLAGRGPLPDACLDPVAAWSAPVAYLQRADADTAVLAPPDGAAAEFWRLAAAGGFGAAAWKLVTLPVLPAATRLPVATRLVVPRLTALDELLTDIRPSNDEPAAWREADRRRREHRRVAVRLAALECGALLATPVGTVEILDVRWWRLLAPPDLEPSAAAAWAGVPEAELIDLESVAGDSSPPEFAELLAKRGQVPGLLADWPGPPLADGRRVDAEGIRLHPAAAALLWRDLAADLLRAWEAGRPVRRLLVVSEAPPPGAATVISAMPAVGATVPTPGSSEPLAPLVWVRPAELLALLESDALPGKTARPGNNPTAFAVDRALVMDLEGLLPDGAGGAAAGACLLGWLAGGAVSRLDLVTGPLSAPWLRFLAERLGARVTDPRSEPGGWTTLRRATVPRMQRCCPQCNHEAPGAVDGAICSQCGFHLVGWGPVAASQAALQARARGLLGQADLGRENLLEIWDLAKDLDVIRQEARAAGARPIPTQPRQWSLPDGRRWHLQTVAVGSSSNGNALLLQTPVDPEAMWPRAPVDGEHELTLSYDRHDLGSFATQPAVDGVERFLCLLGDPVWLEALSEGGGSGHGFRPLISTWRLAWLAGLEQDDVSRYLDLLRWSGVLSGDLAVAETTTRTSGATLAIRAQVSARDMELTLAGLAARLERTLDPMFAGGLAGAWQEVSAPGQDATALPDDPAASPGSRLDRLLALLATWPLPGGARFHYRALAGAWFSSRRRLMWIGDRSALTTDLVRELDGFAMWIRSLLEGASRVDRGYVVEVANGSDSQLQRRLLLGQELGFWLLGDPAGSGYCSLSGLIRLIQTSQATAGPTAKLVRDLARERDDWRRRLAATPSGGTMASVETTLAKDDVVGGARGWWRREGKDPLAAARSAVAELVATATPARLVLAGPFGTGRTGSLLVALAASAAGRKAELWCPDQTTAVRLRLAALGIDRRWQPRLRIWRHDSPLPGRDAPGARQLVVLAELQRFPREMAYQLQEAVREGQLVITVDTAENTSAWEDLFLTTPRRDEVQRLRVQVLQTQQPWRITRPLLTAAATENRGRRRERGQVVSRRAGTLDECAAAIAVSSGSGGLGELVALTAPLAEDVQLLGRALSDRGWAAVERSKLEVWLLPGALELGAALADAHRRVQGAWPGAAGHSIPENIPSLLGEFLEPAAGVDWLTWLRSLPETALADAGDFLARLRRSPWSEVCCLSVAARDRLTAVAGAGGDLGPGDILDTALWQVWRRQLAQTLGRQDLAVGPPALVLAAAADAGGPPAESAAYVCFGPEPEAVHLRSLSRATDRLLVLYQEYSPLPGERDPDGST